MSYTFVSFQKWHLDAIPEDEWPRLCTDTRGITALNEAGEVQGMVVYDTWSFNSVMGHFFIMNPFILKHGFGEAACDYAFNVGGKGMVIGGTPANNKKALKMGTHIGFKNVAVIPDGIDIGIDLVIRVMTREDCRFIHDLDEAISQ